MREFASSVKARGLGTVVAKKKVYFTDSVGFSGHDPVSRSGTATGRGAFEMQSAQAISAAYYFDLAARDHSLADGAIKLIIERSPRSTSIEPSQSCELIFCTRSDRPFGRQHARNGYKFGRNLQEQNRRRKCVAVVQTRCWRLTVVQVERGSSA